MPTTDNSLIKIEKSFRLYNEIIIPLFGNSEFDKYKTEVGEKYYKTPAYTEYTEKAKNYSPCKQNELADGTSEFICKANEHY